jgi:hypothetical protein
MCLSDGGKPAHVLQAHLSSTEARPGHTPGLRLAVDPPDAGSRRQRLWELESHAHCPVVGVCLPIAALRRLAARLLPDHADDSDYDLHCIAVTASKTRNQVSEALHKELERRFQLSLRRAAKARSTEALAAWWRETANGEDLPGALWATLTHARCDNVLSHRVLGEVHMLQHQVGMATRVEIGRFEALIDENAVLARELAAAQARSQRTAGDAARRIEQMEAQLVRMRATLIGRDSLLNQRQEQFESLEAAVPALRERAELTRELKALSERNRDLQRALARAREDADQQRRRADRLLATAASTPGVAVSGAAIGLAVAGAADLGNRAVLCVGGRPASVPIYRQVVERTGGRFLHHDGGDEDSATRLDDTLGAADLVVCQTGCISHGAYWRVKDHCKRHGKLCLFVETPSRSALERALHDAVAGPAALSPVEKADPLHS